MRQGREIILLLKIAFALLSIYTLYNVFFKKKKEEIGGKLSGFLSSKEFVDPRLKWRTCPSRDGSLDSVIVSAIVDGSGIGNQVWAYLSVWAAARRYGIRAAMPEYTLNRMSQVFERRFLAVPSVRELGVKCDLMPWILDAYHFDPLYAARPQDWARLLQTPLQSNVTVIKFGVYVVNAAETVPLWRELAQDLVLRQELRTEAYDRLRDCRAEFFFNLKKYPENRHLRLEQVEFVSVHIRRTDYRNHMQVVYKNASEVTGEFYTNAFNFLKERIKAPLIFIVMTDDMEWAHQNVVINRTDVYLPGNGKYSSPGVDMALMAACNHSVFAYGTFGLTGALLANGGVTVIYDPGNGTVTKEMQFASALPRWHIMDAKGRLNYQDKTLPLTYFTP